MRILVDTNILIRSVERRHPLMHVARQALRALVQQENELCVAPQNVVNSGTFAPGRLKSTA